MRSSHLRCGSVQARLAEDALHGVADALLEGDQGIAEGGWRTKPMIEAAMSSFFASCQAGRRLVSE